MVQKKLQSFSTYYYYYNYFMKNNVIKYFLVYLDMR